MKGKNIVAKYSYKELKQAATEGRRIGGWKGLNVYAISKYKYDGTNNAYYVLYDDDNTLVYKGKVYGSISESGEVTEVTKPYSYFTPKKKNTEVPTASAKVVPATDYSATMSSDEYFSKLDREINELLAGVAIMEYNVKIGDYEV